MALDTETKRRSIHGMGLMFLVIAPVPDGVLSSVDRLHIIGLPGAIAPAVTTTSLNYIGATGKTVAENPPVHIDDSGDNLIILGELEIQKDAYFGGVSNYVRFIDGALVFFGTAGLPYGEINVVGNSTETVIASQNVYVQITVFDTNGENNNVTPDHTNDHITITKAGRYYISCSITLNSVGGPGSTAEMEVKKNNGTSRVGSLHVDRTLSGGGTESGAITITGIVNLAVDDTIEVWLKNETNTQNYIVEDITLSLIQIGG